MCIEYLFFYRALKAQGIDRNTLPYKGWGQPYCAWIGLVFMTTIVGIYGYTTFLPGASTPPFRTIVHANNTNPLGWFTLSSFFSYYTMCFVFPVLYFSWKIIKRTKIVKPHEADLVWERPTIDAYEAANPPSEVGFWEEIGTMTGLRKRKPVEVGAHVE